MAVYANLLGKWIELTDDDIVDGLPPEKFIEQILVAEDAHENSKITNGFVEIVHDNEAYHIHETYIQYTYKR